MAYSSVSGVRRLFDSWVGGITSNPLYILIVANSSYVAQWQIQYALTVNSAYGSTTGAGWFNARSIATFGVNSFVDQGNGTRRAFQSWTGDLLSQSPNSSIIKDGPKTVSALWKTQYVLTIDVKPPGSGTVSPPAGSYWFDKGSYVRVTRNPDNGYRFYYWELDGTNVGSGNRYYVLMNSAHNLVAIFRTSRA